MATKTNATVTVTDMTLQGNKLIFQLSDGHTLTVISSAKGFGYPPDMIGFMSVSLHDQMVFEGNPSRSSIRLLSATYTQERIYELYQTCRMFVENEFFPSFWRFFQIWKKKYPQNLIDDAYIVVSYSTVNFSLLKEGKWTV